jgi:catechol 2,3-dioxygenase-like lactoylglutathione lyase family enzyme
MALITGTDFLIIGCTDLDRSVKFYGETLGLERGKQWGKMPAHEFETGNLTVAVVQLDAFGQEFKPSTSPLEFRVEDFDAAKSELESKGVEFQGEPIDSGVCLQAFFQDPDGNVLGIHHRYAEGAPPAAAG